jgi:GT2 family glycosyltransferase
MTKYPLVSIIVLNWNGKRFVDGFFNSVQSQSYPQESIEILFVDNASSDDSVQYFKSKKIKNAFLIQTGANRGYAGGNNYGFHKAKGEFILVCNNDLELDKHCIERLVGAAQQTQADITVPMLVFAETRTINNAGSMLKQDSDWPNYERGMNQPVNSPDFAERTDVTAFCGACPLFKRSFLEEVGLFDKKFFLYWEDGDLSWRGQKAGKHYVYEPTAVAYHHTSGSTGGSTSPVFTYYVSRNRVLILLKNGRIRYAARAFAKVFRDHVMFKVRDLFRAIQHKNGRKGAVKNLWLGLKIIGGTLWLTPYALGKRWHILQEEKL